MRIRRDHLRAALFAVFLTAILSAFSRGEDLICTDGTIYREATVTQVENDALIIRYKKGVAVVLFVRLPPALRAKFDYDPIKAEDERELKSKKKEAPNYSPKQVWIALNTPRTSEQD